MSDDNSLLGVLGVAAAAVAVIIAYRTSSEPKPLPPPIDISTPGSEIFSNLVGRIASLNASPTTPTAGDFDRLISSALSSAAHGGAAYSSDITDNGFSNSKYSLSMGAETIKASFEPVINPTEWEDPSRCTITILLIRVSPPGEAVGEGVESIENSYQVTTSTAGIVRDGPANLTLTKKIFNQLKAREGVPSDAVTIDSLATAAVAGVSGFKYVRTVTKDGLGDKLNVITPIPPEIPPPGQGLVITISFRRLDRSEVKPPQETGGVTCHFECEISRGTVESFKIPIINNNEKSISSVIAYYDRRHAGASGVSADVLATRAFNYLTRMLNSAAYYIPIPGADGPPDRIESREMGIARKKYSVETVIVHLNSIVRYFNAVHQTFSATSSELAELIGGNIYWSDSTASPGAYISITGPLRGPFTVELYNKNGSKTSGFEILTP